MTELNNPMTAQANLGADSAEIEEYLSQLATLAGSSLAGAMQSTYGALR